VNSLRRNRLLGESIKGLSIMKEGKERGARKKTKIVEGEIGLPKRVTEKNRVSRGRKKGLFRSVKGRDILGGQKKKGAVEQRGTCRKRVELIGPKWPHRRGTSLRLRGKNGDLRGGNKMNHWL